MAPTSPEPTTPATSPAIDNITRRRIELKALKKHTGWSNNECFRKMGIARRTGYRLLNEKSDYNKKKGIAGRPPKITPQQIEEISSWLDKNYASRTSPWQDAKKEFGLDCSWETVRRTMKKAGWPKCHECHNGHATPARKATTKNSTSTPPIPTSETVQDLAPNDIPATLAEPSHEIHPVHDPHTDTYPEPQFEERDPYSEVRNDVYPYAEHNPYAQNPYPAIIERNSSYTISTD
jgi:transposase